MSTTAVTDDNGVRVRNAPALIPWTTPAGLAELLQRRPDLADIGLGPMTEVLAG